METIDLTPMPSSEGAKAWSAYLEIEHVIKAGDKHGIQNFRVDTAVHRLGLAIATKYQLDKSSLTKYQWIQIDPKQVQNLNLTTLKEMLAANIYQWEEGSPAFDHAGMEFNGTPRGYNWQPSINRLLEGECDCSYATLSRMVNTTAQDAWTLFKRIEGAVKVQFDRIKTASPEKARHISSALDRLGQAILQKFQMKRPQGQPAFTSKIEKIQPSKLWLYSINSMLNAHIRIEGKRDLPLSLRQALDIATKNPFNVFGGTYGPLWGQAKALEQVEEALGTVQ